MIENLLVTISIVILLITAYGRGYRIGYEKASVEQSNKEGCES